MAPEPSDSANDVTPAVTPEGSAEEDEMKRRYREALDRKKGAGGGAASNTGDTNKSGGATSNSKTQRMFRRKSGG